MGGVTVAQIEAATEDKDLIWLLAPIKFDKRQKKFITIGLHSTLNMHYDRHSVFGGLFQPALFVECFI